MKSKLLIVTSICLSIFMFAGCSSMKSGEEQEKSVAKVTQNEDTTNKSSEQTTNTSADNQSSDSSSNNSQDNTTKDSTSLDSASANNTNKSNTFKSSTESKESKVTKQTTVKKVSNRYSVAGIVNSAEFEKTFNTVKQLVSKNNKAEVAKYIAYPINVDINGKKTAINKEADFVKNYDKIITPKVKSALVNQKVADAFVNQSGVKVGKGELWFSQFNNNPKRYCL